MIRLPRAAGRAAGQTAGRAAGRAARPAGRPAPRPGAPRASRVDFSRSKSIESGPKAVRRAILVNLGSILGTPRDRFSYFCGAVSLEWVDSLAEDPTCQKPSNSS